LRRLKGALGVRAFAEQLGLSASLVSSYLNGGRLPDAGTLRTIAERTGASLDWLLLGEGDDEPRYRGQSRSTAELATDLASHVTRAVAADYSVPDDSADSAEVVFTQWEGDGPALLTAVERYAQERAAAWCEWAKRQAAIRSESARLTLAGSDPETITYNDVIRASVRAFLPETHKPQPTIPELADSVAALDNKTRQLPEPPAPVVPLRIGSDPHHQFG
jgi:transcriptional regulator with XRE-family HTH domain